MSDLVQDSVDDSAVDPSAPAGERMRARREPVGWRLVSYLVGSLIAVLLIATFMSDRIIAFDGPISALIFGIILGTLMAVVKPLLAQVSMPITCLTFGIVTLAGNAALFWGAAAFTPGVETGVLGALIGAMLTSILGGIVFTIVDEP